MTFRRSRLRGFESLESRQLLAASDLVTAHESSGVEAVDLVPAIVVNPSPTVEAASSAAASSDVVTLDSPLILDTPGQVYRLESSLRFENTGVYIAAENVTLDLNGHTIYYGGSNQTEAHGVVLYLNWHNTEIDIPGARTPLNATIAGGKIVHEGGGALSHAVYALRGHGVTLHGMDISVNGTDSHTVFVRYNGSGSPVGVVIEDSILRSNAANTFNRHAAPANVFVGGALHANGNVIVGGNSGFNVGSGTTITENFIAHRSFATNGYGVFTYNDSNVVIADNIILPSNGRGVILHNGNGHQVLRNVILHLETPNSEFGSALNPPAIRVRQNAAEMTVADNITLGIAGRDLTAASGLYLSNSGSGNSQFTGNVMTTILTGSPSFTRYAQPLTLEGSGMGAAPAGDEIHGNVFQSNHLQVRTEGFDGWARVGEPISQNRFEWTNGSSALANFSIALQEKLDALGLEPAVLELAEQELTSRQAMVHNRISTAPLQDRREFWFTKWSSFNVANHESEVTLLNNDFGEGVDPRTNDFANLTSGAVHLHIGNTHQLRLVNAEGQGRGQIDLVLETDAGDRYELQTDSNGYVDLPILEFSIQKDAAFGAPFKTIDHNQSFLSLVDSSTELTLDHNHLPTRWSPGNEVTLGAVLQAHFTFDETSGSIAQNSAGADDNGLLRDGAAFSHDAERGRVLSLTGDRSRVELDAPVDLGDQWTIAGWFRGLADGTWKTLTRGLGGDHQIIVDASGELGSYDNVGGTRFHGSGFDMNGLGNGWHHVAAVGSGGQTTFFLDGEEVGHISFQSTSGVFSLGNYQNDEQRFSDAIDDLRVYDMLLTADQIAQLANSETEGHWAFDETNGNVAYDTAGGDDNGTLHDGAVFAADEERDRVLNLTGDKSRVELDAPVDLETHWTISGWFRGLAEGTWRTLTRGLSGDHQIIVDAGGELGSYDNVGGTRFHSSGFDMNGLSDGWHHVAAVGADGQTVFFVDGAEVGRIDFQSTSDVYSLGNYQNGNQRFADAIDGLQVHNHAVTTDQVAGLAVAGPAAQWKFDETAGRSAQDSIGGHHSSLHEGASFLHDETRGRVLSLVEEDSRAVLNEPLYLGSQWTIGGWYRDLAQGTLWRTLTRGLSGDHQIIVSESGELGSYDNVGGTLFHGSGFNMNSLSNGWHHVAAVGSGGQTIFYVDGAVVGRISFQSTTDVYSLGNYQNGKQRFADAIDDLRVYSRALTLGQIALMAN